MNSNYIVIALAGAAMGVLIGYLLMRSALERKSKEARELDATVRDRDRELSRVDREHRQEISRLEGGFEDRLKKEKDRAHEKGRELGASEAQQQHLAAMNKVVADYERRLINERRDAFAEGREQAKRELELQSKLFSVEIRPYLRIFENNSLFKKECEVEKGYQYQLLVNGLPAFQPHVVVESTETRAEVNDKNVRELLAVTQKLAEAALQTYLGGGAQFGRIGEAIYKRLPK